MFMFIKLKLLKNKNMKLKIFKSLAIIALFSGVMAGCINDDTYGTPESECTEPALTANKTVAEIVAMATPSATEYVSTTTDIIEGYVTSSDERGNFFKIVSLQTKPTDGSAPVGFSVALDGTALFGEGYKPGNKVYVVLNGLYYAKVDGSLKIGSLFEGEVGRISEFDYPEKVIPSCTVVNEVDLVRGMTVAQALNDNNINTLIDLENVQFKDEFVGGTYYDADDNANTAGGATNRYLIDNTGHEIIFRTSSFANFSGNTIPSKSGTVRGVLTKYGSDYQFMARSESDIMLTNDRLIPGEPGGGDEPSPGAALAFPGGNFEDYSAFLGNLNSFGIPTYATQSTGTGMNGSNALHIATSAAVGNDYVFTSFAYSGLPATYTKLQFYVKGTSSKSISINLYKTGGTDYYKFNLSNISANTIVSATSANQYTGSIDTGGEWVLITLDLTGITDLNTSNNAANFFALKIGSGVPYDLYLDNFTIE
jgi:hypothetical protein